MSSFLISDATAADYPAFVRLFPELEVVDPVPSAERFAEVIVPQSVFAREGHAIVGFGWSKPRGERLYVVNLIADPAHRRRGICHNTPTSSWRSKPILRSNRPSSPPEPR